jgi:hypothetical protein
MGDFPSRFWAGRPVLVTAAGTPLGHDLLAELLIRRAAVVALVGRGEMIGPHAGRVAVVRGRPDDPARLTTALVLHDIRTVFHLASAGLAAVRAALRTAGGELVLPPAAPVVVAVLIRRAESLATPAARAA